MDSFATFIMALDIIVLLGMLCYVVMTKERTILHNVFFFVIVGLIVWDGAVLAASSFAGDPSTFVFVDNFSYFGAAFVPVTMLMLGFAYQKDFRGFNWRYAVFYVVPVITMVTIFTNDAHHLFYVSYSVEAGYEQGPFFYVYAIYTYVCLYAGMVLLYVASVRAQGVFSPLALIVLVACLLPGIANMCYTFHVPGFHVYSTPLVFSVSVLLLLIGMFRFGFLKVVPVATQTAINRISDCFVVISRDTTIVNCNDSFTKHFLQVSTSKRLSKLDDVLAGMDFPQAQKQSMALCVTSAFELGKEQVCDIVLPGERPRYYTAEYTPVVEGTRFPALVILFKDVTQHVQDMQALRENQNILLERERLASLGQMIGGIAHNLKSPILAISGAIDQTQCLVSEYRDSIGDPEVTLEDHQEIAQDMSAWLTKMKAQLAYMSDIITTVKGQVTLMSERGGQPFPVREALKRIRLLMQHSLVRGGCQLETKLTVSEDQVIIGDVNSLVQVLDNIIDNAIQAYDGKGGPIVLAVDNVDEDVRFAVTDQAGGIQPEVQRLLFKEMTTTKGKNGTGLGLYISCSTIKGMFQGKMWFDTELGVGTTFYVQIPVKSMQRESALEEDARVVDAKG